jgi:hypothetical protein
MVVPVMRHITCPAGRRFPVLGQGTWHMAEADERRREEIAGRRDEVFPVSKALPFPRPAAAPSTHARPASADCGPTGSICTSSTWPSRR